VGRTGSRQKSVCFFSAVAMGSLQTMLGEHEPPRAPQESAEVAGERAGGTQHLDGALPTVGLRGRAGPWGQGLQDRGGVFGRAHGRWGLWGPLFGAGWVYETQQPPSFLKSSQRLWAECT